MYPCICLHVHMCGYMHGCLYWTFRTVPIGRTAWVCTNEPCMTFSLI